MVYKSRSENILTGSPTDKKRPPAKKANHKESNDIRKNVNNTQSTVKNLETSLMESKENDRELTMTKYKDIKNKKLAYELEEARKENKQLLNVLQQQCSDQDVSKSSSRSQLDRVSSSYSTISMVHLQYKYEELLASHEGLLKVLETKIKESQKCYRENDGLRDDVQKLTVHVSDNESTIKTLCHKYLNLKERKDKKISNLRYERDTLRLVHNQLVNLLDKKCMDDDNFLTVELKSSRWPTKALLLNEIKSCNKLQHENARLQQENRILKSRLGFSCVEN